MFLHFSFFSVTLVSALSHPDTIDLTMAFRLADTAQESLAVRAERIKQSQRQYWQTLGSVLPTVSGAASSTWQDKSASATPSNGSDPQRHIRLTVTQPLFKGLREWMAAFESDRLLEVERLLLQATRLEIYDAVARSFYLLLSLQEEREHLLTQVTSVEARVNDLQKRVRIGRSRKSDLLASQVSLETLAAHVARLESQYAAERETFKFLTKAPDDFVVKDSSPVPETVPPLEKLLETSSQNPLVSSKHKNLQAAEYNRRGAWGEYLPTADLSGNYYLHRTGALKNVDWDIKVEVTIPLFAGGTTWQKVQQSRSKERQADLEWRAAKRELELKIRSLYLNVQGSLREFQKLDQARNNAKLNYKEQAAQYELGLVSNLDVLAALNSQTDVERSRTKALYEARTHLTHLELTTGLQRSLAP